jgi:hypothetical protein
MSQMRTYDCLPGLGEERVEEVSVPAGELPCTWLAHVDKILGFFPFGAAIASLLIGMITYTVRPSSGRLPWQAGPDGGHALLALHRSAGEAAVVDGLNGLVADGNVHNAIARPCRRCD